MHFSLASYYGQTTLTQSGVRAYDRDWRVWIAADTEVILLAKPGPP